VEDPALAKGLVQRAVTEVLTPGTALVPELLTERDSHYALALTLPAADAPQRPLGFAFLDFSTGNSASGTRGSGSARSRGALCAARGVPAAERHGGTFESALRQRFAGVPVAHVEDALFAPRLARETLFRHFAVASLEGLDCADQPEGVRAAGALLEYGGRLKQGRLNAVTRVQVVRPRRRCSSTTTRSPISRSSVPVAARMRR